MIKTKTHPKGRPFKKFYCDRPNVFLIPAPAFKIWMYHYIRLRATQERDGVTKQLKDFRWVVKDNMLA